MRQTKRALALLLVFFAGCAASTVAQRYAVPVARADTTPQRWEYTCQRASDGITPMANKFGQEGWELTAAAGAGWGTGLAADSTMVWCFKRPLP